MDASRVAVYAGSHGGTVDKKQAVGPVQRLMVLAHYPEREPKQAAAKVVVGRLKVIASGPESVSPVISNHYIAPFEALRTDPAGWVQAKLDELRRWDEDLALMLDPVPYLGGRSCLRRWWTRRRGYCPTSYDMRRCWRGRTGTSWTGSG